ncbi:hypothetical protein DWY58_03470 [Bacteroides stercoris]|uniref:Uncharacterized protein n=1 Tax=Bacteroides stercoris TaxID=46506 RepID=A0A3E4UPQ0_BACSE|nr:hypothetical protein DXC34_07445 [Bacteroides stercoris]RGR29099.1 hypothetical protein DWY58_03470 [Bacteroides stercoris]RGR35882.1 hypothetical protein DWY52_08960 [Bacteroides stercoris]
MTNVLIYNHFSAKVNKKFMSREYLTRKGLPNYGSRFIAMYITAKLQNLIVKLLHGFLRP